LLRFTKAGFPEFYRQAATLGEDRWLYTLLPAVNFGIENTGMSVLAAKAIFVKRNIVGGT